MTRFRVERVDADLDPSVSTERVSHQGAARRSPAAPDDVGGDDDQSSVEAPRERHADPRRHDAVVATLMV